MNIGKPFLIDIDETEFENHIEKKEDDFPFEFSHTNMWNSHFFAPEVADSTAFELMKSEIEDIKQLVADIKNILTDIFELQKKTDRE